MSKILSPTKVQAELNKLAKTTQTRSVNELRMVLALERVIARVETHKILSKHFVFKGGFVLLKTTNSDRFTRDVDALSIGLSRRQIPNLMREALSQNLQDGLWFGDIKNSDLKTKGPYGGYNFNVAFTIGDAPAANDPKIKKFSRGSNNSRSKDVYDMQFIFKKCKDKKFLQKAIRKTFENRKTPIPKSFLETAQEFELGVLRAAWRSVELSTNKGSFESVWEDFLDVLRSLEPNP